MRNLLIILLMFTAGITPHKLSSAQDTADKNPEDSALVRAPSFELVGIDGKTYRLSDYRAEMPLIVWFTNLCGGCQANIPHLDSVYSAEIKPNAELLAVSLLGEDKETVASIRNKLKFRFPILFDPQGKTCEDYVGEYVEASCPAVNLFVIDRQGTIRYETHFPGHSESEAISMLKTLFDEKAGAAKKGKEDGQ